MKSILATDMVIEDGMSEGEKVLKRLFDIVLSACGLVLLSPLFLIIYICMRCKGVNSVLFRQERIGYKGRPFMIIKFRTMREDAEKDGRPRLAEVDDERIMPLGGFLRTHHIDELPQLWNVLKGDMSVVGPRPERRYFIEKIMEVNPDYEYLYLMRPGLTSAATIYNGYTNTIEKMITRLQMDLDYLQHRSLWLDVKIMAKTVYYIFNGKKL